VASYICDEDEVVSRPANIRILRGDLVHGPLTRQEVERLLSEGRIVSSDLMSVDDGPWVSIASQLGNATQSGEAGRQPPTAIVEPKALESVPPIIPSLDIQVVLCWTYRVAIALALVGVFLPWYTVSSTISAPVLGGGSSYAAVAGTSTGWGLLSLLCLVTSVVLSFLSKDWKLHGGAATAAVVVSGLAAIQLSSSTPFGANFHSTFGGATATAGTSLGIGLWLTLIGSLVAVVVSYVQGKTQHVGTAAFQPFMDRMFRTFSSRAVAHSRNNKSDASLNDEPVTASHGHRRLISLPQWAWGVIAGLVVVLVFVLIQSRPTENDENGTTSGESRTQELPGGIMIGGRYVVTEDACVYEFPMGDIATNGKLIALLFHQAVGGRSLAGGKADVGDATSEAHVVSRGTELDVLKTQIETYNTGAYTVHFVRVCSGRFKGKEGWISDRVIRLNR